MSENILAGAIQKTSISEALVPTTFKKYSRHPNYKYFRQEYKDAKTESDRNLISLVNAMVNSNRPVTILTRKIFEDIVSNDQNWSKPRTLNNKQYSHFLGSLKDLKHIFQIVHQYTRTAPMIIRIVHPKLRFMTDLSPSEETILLRKCEEFRANKDFTQTPAEALPIVVPPPMAPAIMNELVLTVAELREKQKELLSNSSWSDNTLSGIVDGPPDRVVVINDNDEEVILSRSDLMEEDCTVLGEISPYADFLEDDPEESSGS